MANTRTESPGGGPTGAATSGPERELNLLVIVSSVRQGRFGPVVARWFEAQARQHNRFRVDLLDLAETPLPTQLPSVPPLMWDGGERPAELTALAARLAAADAFVVVTPEYNHSFPASIKHLVDWHYREWEAKPVGFVSYGGTAGGLLAVEQLRPVFAELHAVTVRDVVCFPRYWEQFDPDGQPRQPDGPSAAAKTMLDQLAWWGGALAEARRRTPYRGS
jgi:NAD(P)H-dependent FMN reductase